jgi:hypothetical protein
MTMLRKINYPTYLIGASIISVLGVLLIFPCIFETRAPLFLGEVCTGVPIELSVIILILWFLLANSAWYLLSRG